MLVLGFTSLCLGLFAGGLWFAYSMATNQFRSLLRAERQRSRKRIAAAEAKVATLNAEVAELGLHVRREKGIPTPSTNLFSKSEERHSRNLKQVIKVNDEPVSLIS